MDFACGQFGLLCGRYGCGQCGLWCILMLSRWNMLVTVFMELGLSHQRRQYEAICTMSDEMALQLCIPLCLLCQADVICINKLPRPSYRKVVGVGWKVLVIAPTPEEAHSPEFSKSWCCRQYAPWNVSNVRIAQSVRQTNVTCSCSTCIGVQYATRYHRLLLGPETLHLFSVALETHFRCGWLMLQTVGKCCDFSGTRLVRD